jgi:hypothetical protein
MILLRPGIKPAISRTVCNPSRALSKFWAAVHLAKPVGSIYLTGLLDTYV